MTDFVELTKDGWVRKQTCSVRVADSFFYFRRKQSIEPTSRPGSALAEEHLAEFNAAVPVSEYTAAEIEQLTAQAIRTGQGGIISDYQVKTFISYQILAAQTAVYPKDQALAYLALGLAGEAGEFANKVKKIMRGDAGETLTTEITHALASELGGCLWYLSEAAAELGFSLDSIATLNIAELYGRAERGTIKGSGDER